MPPPEDSSPFLRSVGDATRVRHFSWWYRSRKQLLKKIGLESSAWPIDVAFRKAGTHWPCTTVHGFPRAREWQARLNLKAITVKRRRLTNPARRDGSATTVECQGA